MTFTPGQVDLGIACNKWQNVQWWQGVMLEVMRAQARGIKIDKIHAVSSAMPDHSKNKMLDDKQPQRYQPKAPADEKRESKTDANRNKILNGFLYGTSEWLWFLDDDTVPPEGALEMLLSLNHPAVAGIYFLAKSPHNPIAYMRGDDGLYSALWNYPHAGIIEVDSVGMGCTLVHRSVFEKLQREFVTFQRASGALYPVHRSRIDVASLPEAKSKTITGGTERVNRMELIIPLAHVHPDDPRPWPFFLMEHGRTEDHFFWELVAQVGIRPRLDTSILCRHIRELDFGWEHHHQAREATKDQWMPTQKN